MNKFGCIYGVYLKSKLIYIGQTKHPKIRFYQIFSNGLNCKIYFNPILSTILHKSISIGVIPKFKILKICKIEELKYLESKFINKLGKKFLVNIQNNSNIQILNTVKSKEKYVYLKLIRYDEKKIIRNKFILNINKQLSFYKITYNGIEITT